MKENRTYDQVLGDMKEGNGDPSLVLFGENVTPNLHKIGARIRAARQLLRECRRERRRPQLVHRGHRARLRAEAVAQQIRRPRIACTISKSRTPPRCRRPATSGRTPARRVFRSAISATWWRTSRRRRPREASRSKRSTIPLLAKVTNRVYRGFDLNYPDVDRAKTFLADLAEFEKTGDMPRLMVMRLRNDHTSGVTAGKLSPLAQAADNDQAVGMIVEGISKSQFWGSTAIFVLEDDAQNGPDHVDSHRSPAFVISPYVKRHAVDSNMYNTTSMLRTIELILGLRPMTQFDAAAPPMTAAFQTTPDLTPYSAGEAAHAARCPQSAARAAAQSPDNMKFDREDENNDDELNDILWRAIRKDTPPPPVRSYFGK